MSGNFFLSGVRSTLDAISHGCPVEFMAILQTAGVDFNQVGLGVNLLVSAIRYLRDDVLEFCLNIVTDHESKDKALRSSLCKGTLCAAKILVRHGADLHQQVTHVGSKLYARDMLQFLLDEGIVIGDASIIILLNNVARQNDRLFRNIDPLGRNGQLISHHHLQAHAVIRLLLSHNPHLIDENWNGIQPTPLVSAIDSSQVCLVVMLIQYGANLEGTGDIAFMKLLQRIEAHPAHVHPNLKWHALGSLIAVIHASTSLHVLSGINTNTGGSLLQKTFVCFKNRMAHPHRLQELCRTTIVRQMHGRALPAIPGLGMPLPLQRYLRYEDLIRDLTVCICPKSSHQYVSCQTQCLCVSLQIDCYKHLLNEWTRFFVAYCDFYGNVLCLIILYIIIFQLVLRSVNDLRYCCTLYVTRSTYHDPCNKAKYDCVLSRGPRTGEPWTYFFFVAK